MTINKNRDDQRVKIMKTISGLMVQLGNLAPHPERPNYKGALFTALPVRCKAPGAYDSLPASLVLESMFGASFAEAASDATGGLTDQIDIASTLEAYDAYKSEMSENNEKVAAHGRGSFARMSGPSIRNSFNARGNISQAMQAFFDDMPKRMRIEGQLAFMLRQLNALNAQTPTLAPRFAA